VQRRGIGCGRKVSNSMTDIAVPSTTGSDTPQPNRRLQILEAAATCFARSGFHGTSMQEICVEANMSPGALYRYFRSKDEIITAIAEEKRSQNARNFKWAGAEGSFHDHIVGMGMAFLGHMRATGKAALMAEIIAESLRNSTIGQQFQKNEGDSRVLLLQLIDAAVASGEIDRPDEPDLALSCLIATGEGLVIRMAFDPALTLERVEPLLRLVVEGLFPPRRRTSLTDSVSQDR
jgi:TetR/AcrR family transcriptional regulator, repressor for uid operon